MGLLDLGETTVFSSFQTWEKSLELSPEWKKKEQPLENEVLFVMLKKESSTFFWELGRIDVQLTIWINQEIQDSSGPIIDHREAGFRTSPVSPCKNDHWYTFTLEGSVISSCSISQQLKGVHVQSMKDC